MQHKDESRDTLGLRDRDLEDLRLSGLTDETIRMAGIFFVTESVARQLLHRKDLHGDGYAFPYVDLTGRPILQRDGQLYVNIKLDTPPRDKMGKPQKYLKPKGEPNCLYVPPGVADAVREVTRPLLFTEGEKKALKAMQEGFPCPALPGVWGFRTRRGLKAGASLPLQQLDAIPMSGRDIFVVFDSDLATNVQVQQAEQAFARYARNRGATVYPLRLPGNSDGSKVGLDDLLTQHGPEALRALMEKARRGDAGQGVRNETIATYEIPYRETAQGIVRLKRERDGGLTFVPIANFTARVVEEIIRDDGGGSPIHVYRIEGSCQGRSLQKIDILASRFSGMSWLEEWGLAPTVLPPSTNKEYARHAIQVFSADSVRTRSVYEHTGWRRIDGRWVYLHGGGGIGAESVDVNLPTELMRYSLPPVPDDLDAAVRQSMRLLNVAPTSVTVPLLAAVYLAPLVSFLSPKPGFSLFLYGESGAFKTSLACLALSHFGEFATAEALSNFSDTPNALERRAFVLKDTLMLIDDFYPTAVPHEAQSRELTLQRLVRAAGNRTGRARLTREATEKRRYEPRGFLLITGEELPAVQSTLARLLIVDLDRETVDKNLLTDLQTHAHELSQCMAAYLHWLAPRMDAMKEEAPEGLRDIRTQATSACHHPRLAETVAVLFYGFHQFLEFTVASGAVEDAKAGELAAVAWKELLQLATRQSVRIQEEDPASRFLEILHALLDGERVWLKRPGLASSAPCIGVEEGDVVYLYPTQTWHAIREYCRNESSMFPVKPRSLYKMLAARGWLQKEGSSHEARATIEGKRRRVLAMPATLLLGTREMVESVP